MIAIACVGYRMWASLRPLAFDSGRWKRDNFDAFSRRPTKELTLATRDRMVTDLLRRFPLAGMTRREITNLLGQPDFSREAPFADWDMIYWLGPDDRLTGMLDFMYLVLRLDAAGTVQAYKVTCD
jgi:hypothetical protein